MSNLPDEVVFVKIVLLPSFRLTPPKINESRFKRYLLFVKCNPVEIF